MKEQKVGLTEDSTAILVGLTLSLWERGDLALSSPASHIWLFSVSKPALVTQEWGLDPFTMLEKWPPTWARGHLENGMRPKCSVGGAGHCE